MSKPLSKKALKPLEGSDHLRAEIEQLFDESERLLNESHHLRAGSEQLRMDSAQLFAQSEWLRRRFTATCAALGLEPDHGTRLQRHHQTHDARAVRG